MPNKVNIVKFRQLESLNKTLSSENKKYKTQIEELQKKNKDSVLKLNAKEKELKNKTVLKNNPIVLDILRDEKNKSKLEINKKNLQIEELNKNIIELKTKYEYIDQIKPIQKDDFNRFLSSSIIDLQNELSSTDDEYEFFVKDLEVQTNLLVELRETGRGVNKKSNLVYILPTTTQLKDIEQDKMHRLKFSLTVVPKD